MPLLHAAWMFYSQHPALVINALGLFYALSGSWLLLATQVRNARSLNQMAASPAGITQEPSPTTLRINRMFNRVGSLCLGSGLVLSLISTQL